jgi:Uma2 family endonuclease
VAARLIPVKLKQFNFMSGQSIIPSATPAKWSVNDYHRMIKSGILRDRRVELINGEIWEMPPEGPLHTSTNINAVKYLRSLLDGLAEVREAHPITLANSEPEPDVAIVRLPDIIYLTRHPQPDDIYWLIEIAERTLAIDLGRKKKDYALAQIEEYWVIDLTNQKFLIFRDPVGDNYTDEREVTQGTVNPLAFSSVRVSVDRLLGTNFSTQ